MCVYLQGCCSIFPSELVELPMPDARGRRGRATRSYGCTTRVGAGAGKRAGGTHSGGKDGVRHESDLARPCGGGHHAAEPWTRPCRGCRGRVRPHGGRGGRAPSAGLAAAGTTACAGAAVPMPARSETIGDGEAKP
jgi:hypothetical protein